MTVINDLNAATISNDVSAAATRTAVLDRAHLGAVGLVTALGVSFAPARLSFRADSSTSVAISHA
jgi:hypothetical protein